MWNFHTERTFCGRCDVIITIKTMPTTLNMADSSAGFFFSILINWYTIYQMISLSILENINISLLYIIFYIDYEQRRCQCSVGEAFRVAIYTRESLIQEQVHSGTVNSVLCIFYCCWRPQHNGRSSITPSISQLWSP